MKIYRTLTINSETGEVLFEDSYQYSEPISFKADRSLNQAGKNAAKTATVTGADYGSQANEIGGQLIPGLEREAQGGQGYTPVEQGHQLVAGEQGAGGATSGITGTANLEAARTRNAGGFGGALDEAAREKGRTLSENALGVANKSADLAQKKQMFAQGELGAQRGQDIQAQLHAMGLVPEDINASANAQKVGWLQDFNDIMQDLQGGAKAFSTMKNA